MNPKQQEPAPRRFSLIKIAILALAFCTLEPVIRYLVALAKGPISNMEALPLSIPITFAILAVAHLWLFPPYWLDQFRKGVRMRRIRPNSSVWPVSLPRTSEEFFEKRGAQALLEPWQRLREEGVTEDATLQLLLSRSLGIEFAEYGRLPLASLPWSLVEEVEVEYSTSMEMVDGELSELGYETITLSVDGDSFQVRAYDHEGLAKAIREAWPSDVLPPRGNLFEVRSPYDDLPSR